MTLGRATRSVAMRICGGRGGGDSSVGGPTIQASQGDQRRWREPQKGQQGAEGTPPWLDSVGRGLGMKVGSHSPCPCQVTGMSGRPWGGRYGEEAPGGSSARAVNGNTGMIYLGGGVEIKGHVASTKRALPVCLKLTLYLWKKVK